MFSACMSLQRSGNAIAAFPLPEAADLHAANHRAS
jgi:hypothetical protein